jgi:transposase-like protein
MSVSTPSSELFKVPSFCPNSDCEHHHENHDKSSRWFIKRGVFPTQIRGKVQRFQCKTCGSSFSSQTFHISYHSHSNVDYEQISTLQRSCVGVRQICRALNISIMVYINSIHRLARCNLGLFDRALADWQIQENAAMDGFESFVVSQYSPTNVHLLAGSISQFPYSMDLVVMNRKGRMTTKQKLHRDILQTHWTAPKSGIVNSCKILFTEVLSMISRYTPGEPWILYTDEKREYVTAMKRVRGFKKKLLDKSILHIKISSKADRNLQNRLFSVNYLDREIRTTSAGHVRETTRHDREVHMSECRMMIWMGHHGFFKSFRIEEVAGKNKDLTHAEVAGLLEVPGVKQAKTELFTHRRLHSLRKSSLNWITKIWQRETENPKYVNFETGNCKKKGQPGNKKLAKHLVA